LMEEGRRPNYVSLALGEVQDWQHEMQGRCSSDGEEKEGSGGDRERERGAAEAIAGMGCHGHDQASRTARREKRGFLAC
jgi:hypothetical protein